MYFRWLSFTDSVQAVVEIIPSIISSLQAAGAEKSDREGRALLFGLAKDMATYRFIHLCGFLADCIGFIGIVSKQLQMANPTYQEAVDAVCIP